MNTKLMTFNSGWNSCRFNCDNRAFISLWIIHDFTFQHSNWNFVGAILLFRHLFEYLVFPHQCHLGSFLFQAVRIDFSLGNILKFKEFLVFFSFVYCTFVTVKAFIQLTFTELSSSDQLCTEMKQEMGTIEYKVFTVDFVIFHNI